MDTVGKELIKLKHWNGNNLVDGNFSFRESTCTLWVSAELVWFL